MFSSHVFGFCLDQPSDTAPNDQPNQCSRCRRIDFWHWLIRGGRESMDWIFCSWLTRMYISRKSSRHSTFSSTGRHRLQNPLPMSLLSQPYLQPRTRLVTLNQCLPQRPVLNLLLQSHPLEHHPIPRQPSKGAHRIRDPHLPLQYRPPLS